MQIIFLNNFFSKYIEKGGKIFPIINYCRSLFCLRFRKLISLKDQFAQIEGEISFAR